jgi:hypothetical protein
MPCYTQSINRVFTVTGEFNNFMESLFATTGAAMKGIYNAGTITLPDGHRITYASGRLTVTGAQASVVKARFIRTYGQQLAFRAARQAGFAARLDPEGRIICTA